MQSGHSFGDRWRLLSGREVALNSESVGREGRAVGGVEGGGGGAVDDVVGASGSDPVSSDEASLVFCLSSDLNLGRKIKVPTLLF